jgi:formiminotetrahydrofolate cyclodeaminase
MLINRTVSDLLDAFASPDPTPGGGSAAALAAALGASLLAMVAGMTKTKTGSPEARKALDEARGRLMAARATLMGLVDRDSAAYDLVVAAYGQPKGTDAEKAARRDAIQRAMRVATEVPLETATVSAGALGDAAAIEEHGNPNATSDVGTGIALLGAGIRGALLNVEANIGSLTDPAVVAEFRQRRSVVEGDRGVFHRSR